MDLYSIWKNSEGNFVLISEMDSDYIINCVRQINKCAGAWRFETFNDLTPLDI